MRPTAPAALPSARFAALAAWLRAVIAFVAVIAAVSVPLAARAADPWLFVNDVHFDRTSTDAEPITEGGDTNAALLDSLLREMHRIAPDPPVIVMAGDFLAHHFKSQTAVPTMVELARRFDRAFPHAQFLIALGNEDSPCGDYAVPANSSFLRAVTTAWAPLVNRNGAAPDFKRTFVHYGFYTAKLPLSNVRAVVVDDAFWSALYHDGCRAGGNPTMRSLAELAAAVPASGTERRWLVMHIPPGVDAQSTVTRAHHLAIVPFLRPSPRDDVLRLIADPARRIELVITGHVHRFGYRIIDRGSAAPVPLLVSPAVSPVFGNLPSFLTADVAPNGVIRNLEEHSLVDRRWQDIGGLGTLGVSEFSGRALLELQRRLERDPALRDKFGALYMGDSREREIDAEHWRPYWCAASEFTSTGFRDCLDEGGFSFLTRRGVVVVGAAIVGILVAIAASVGIIVLVLRRRRAARVRF